MKFLLALVLLLPSVFCCQTAHAANNFVQATPFSQNFPGTGIPVTASFSKPVIGGPRSMCFVMAQIGGGLDQEPTISDDQKNAWIKIQDVVNGWNQFMAWYVIGCKPNTQKVSILSGAVWASGFTAEYQGVLVLDTAQTRTRDSAAYAVEAPRTNSPSELLLFWAGNLTTNGLAFAPDDEIKQRAVLNGNQFFGDGIIDIPNGLYAAVVFLLDANDHRINRVTNWTAGSATFVVE